MELSENKQVIVERHNKAVYHDSDRIVKVFKAEKPASDIFNEALNIARVIEAGVRVGKRRGAPLPGEIRRRHHATADYRGDEDNHERVQRTVAMPRDPRKVLRVTRCARFVRRGHS